jgi:hypothetical protein
MKQYQRALFWRHLFPFVWPGVQPSERAKAIALSKAEASGGTEATEWSEMMSVMGIDQAADEGENHTDEPVAKRPKA